MLIEYVIRPKFKLRDMLTGYFSNFVDFKVYSLVAGFYQGICQSVSSWLDHFYLLLWLVVAIATAVRC